MTLFDSISLIAASILLLFFSESTILFQTATLVGTAVTIHMFFRMIKDPNLVRFGNMACFSILLGYAGSTGIYTILNFAYYAGFDYTINEFWLSYSQTSISHALLFVFIVSVLLSAIAHFEKPLCISDYLEGSLSAQSLWLILFSAVLIMFGFFNSDIGYMGIYQMSERRISPFGALCFIAIPPLTVITTAYLSILPNTMKRYRKLLIAVSVCLGLALIPLGRRVLMYTIILAAILIGPILIEKFRKSRFRVLHILGIGLLAVIILGWGFRAFYAIRISIPKFALEAKPNVLEIAPYIMDLLRDSYATAELHEKIADNISRRPFILSYLAGLIDAHTEKSIPPFGELGHALMMAVPSLLQPQKTSKMPPASEDVMHPLLGLQIFDGPNTILTAGLNDLGFIGILIYPLAVVVFYIFIYRMILPNWSPFLSLFILLRLMYSILYVEESLGALVGSGLRDLAIVTFIYWVILKISTHKLAIGRFRKTDA